MLIGELSKRSGFSRDTIRYYEKLGILATGIEKRADSSYKNYTLAILERLHHIRHLKACGFTLLEIKGLLTHDGGDQACENLPAQLAAKIREIDEKMTVLLEFKQSLLQIQQSCSGACTTIQGIPNCIPPVEGRKKA